jgi:hypothetical protein
MSSASSEPQSALETSPLYQPLDTLRKQIRLVEIFPATSADDTEPVQCRLNVTNLDHAPPYLALSYVWGDAAITQDVILNGLLHPVTTNLAAALWHFRKFGMPGETENETRQVGSDQFLWIDAISINQKDLQERSHQIQLMGTIFSQAAAVVAWLGPGDDRTRWVDMINDIAPVIEAYAEPNCWERPDDMPEERRRLALEGFTWLQSRGIDLSNHLCTGSSFDFFQLNYWERSWIVQEMVRAQSQRALWFVYGNRWTNFHALFALTKFFEVLGAMPVELLKEHQIRETMDIAFIQIFPWSSFFRPVRETEELRRRFDSKRDLVRMLPDVKNGTDVLFIGRDLFEVILTSALGHTSSEPRDMVYALLGLAANTIVPDYTKPVRQVYLDLVRSGTPARIDLCLVYSGHGHGFAQENEHQLPSWMPNLSKMKLGQVKACFANPAGPATRSLLRASGHGDMATVSLPDGILQIQGAICDKVQTMIPMDFNGDSLPLLYDPKHVNLSELSRLCVNYMIIAKDMTVLNDKKALHTLFRVLYGHEGYVRDQSWEHGSGLCPVARCFGYFLTSIITKFHAGSSEEDLRRLLGFPEPMPLGLFLMASFRGSGPMEAVDAWAMAKEEITDNAWRADFSRWLHRLTSKSLFITSKGHLGMGPRLVHAGDHVCVLDGVEYLSLLRKVDDHWIHIGAAHVPGLVDDNPQDMVERGELEMQTFDIH